MASVKRRSDNGKWKVRYRDPEGHQRSKDFARQVDANRFANKVETDMHDGAWVDPRKGNVRLNEWAATRFDTRKMAVRATTHAAQTSVYTSLVSDTLGKQKLAHITQPAVQAWVQGLEARGLAPSTVRKGYQILAAMLDAAVEAEMIAKSPCRRITLPAEAVREMHFLNPEEVATLADEMDPRYRALVLLGAYGGLRVGEMSALRRSRVQLPKGVVKVEETLVEVSGVATFQPPKTRASRRSVVLPRPVVDELGAHMGQQDVGREPGALVFRSPEGGPLRLASWRRRFWLPAVERAGFQGLRIHDLRHTAVALWIATGANPKAISSRAGHTSVSFTLDRYGHLFEDADETLSGQLEALYVSRV